MNKLRMLLIEDDENWIKSLEKDLNQAGVFDLAVERSKVEAEDKLWPVVEQAAPEFDLILVDLQLDTKSPTRLDGIALINNLRTPGHAVRCPIIIVTNQYTVDQARQSCHDTGAAHGLWTYVKSEGIVRFLGLVALALANHPPIKNRQEYWNK